jgi:adenylate cyclase
MNLQQPGKVLIVDDTELNIDVIIGMLDDQYDILVSMDGPSALELVEKARPDMILLDIMMPGMDGFEVARRVRLNPATRSIPIVMVTALDAVEDRVKALEAGADDFLTKPVDALELRARVKASMEVKRLRDRELEHLGIIEAERARSDALLLNVMPAPIAARLKHGETLIADSHDAATILFADIVGFTSMAAGITAHQLVARLNSLFLTFDSLVDKHGLEKIKNIGDAYMVASGVPQPRQDHAEAMAQMALDMVDATSHFSKPDGSRLQVRIGINTGPVVAGIIGAKRFQYDLWGDAVNAASRMESHGLPGRIQVSESTYSILEARFEFEARGTIEVKGMGPMTTYFLVSENGTG